MKRRRLGASLSARSGSLRFQQICSGGAAGWRNQAQQEASLVGGEAVGLSIGVLDRLAAVILLEPRSSTRAPHPAPGSNPRCPSPSRRATATTPAGPRR